jgi:hypothetical protein
MSVFGSCDMSTKFVNGTGLTISIPSEGHRVKNHGSVEGWNKLVLGGSVDDLADGASKSTRQTLSIKCVDDAEFEIHYTSAEGGDFTQVFTSVDIVDKNATLKLTHH